MLSPPSHVPDISSPMSLEGTTEPHAPKSPRKNFRHVYTHQPKISTSESVLVDSSPMKGLYPQPSAPLSDLDVSIALHKGKWSCIVHSISQFVSYDHLNLSFRQFVMSLSSISIDKSYEEAILVATWKQTMDEEINALVS